MKQPYNTPNLSELTPHQAAQAISSNFPVGHQLDRLLSVHILGRSADRIAYAYSANINTAVLIVNALIEFPQHYRLTLANQNGIFPEDWSRLGWLATFRSCSGNNNYPKLIGVAADPALAICRAALKLIPDYIFLPDRTVGEYTASRLYLNWPRAAV